MIVHITYQDGEFLATDPRYHIHGYGPTPSSAMHDFLQVLSDSRSLLEADEPNLDPYLTEQLSYLRSLST